MDKLANENLNLKNKYFEMLKKFKEYKVLIYLFFVKIKFNYFYQDIF
jgi:hypothetical protein